MKTIEEAAKELLRKKGIKNTDNENNIVRTAWFDAGFREGVEFAQRWIPVEEELPPVGELVQCKYHELVGKGTDCYEYDILIEIEGEKLFSIEQCAVKVIGWRPVNIK